MSQIQLANDDFSVKFLMVENHKSPAERPSLAMLSKTTIPGKPESKQSSRM